MKKTILLLLSLLALSSCGGDNTPTEIITPKENLTVYLDYSEASTSNYRVKVHNASASSYEAGNNSFSITLLIKNLTTQTQEISFSNLKLVRESTGASYTIGNSWLNQPLKLDSEIEGSVSFSSTIPTTLEEKYYFSVDFKDISYKVFLYETPDELREDLIVTYNIGSTTVHAETVKKGRTLTSDYTYDDELHQNYTSTWKDSNGKSYTKGTKIEENVVLSGTLQSNLTLSTTGSDVYTYINGIRHVHPDGKVVILDKYYDKEVCLGNYAIHNTTKIKEIYLPSTLHYIYNGNFSDCGNLKTIYYAGTQEEWDLIPKDLVTIPSSVSIVFNTAFVI